MHDGTPSTSTRRGRFRRRGALAALAALVALDAIPVALRQTGVIRHLPDPPGRIFDSDAVTSSRIAYPLGVPDGLLGVVGFSALAALAGFPPRKARLRRAADLALRAGALVGGLGSLFYLAAMIGREKRACVYCLAAIAGGLAIVPLALAETRAR